MRPDTLRDLLTRVAAGEISPEEAETELRFLPFSDIGFAKVDHHRELRSGFAEAIYCPGKSPSQVAEIAVRLIDRARGAVIATRATRAQYDAVASVIPDAEFDEVSSLIVIRRAAGSPLGVVTVASAGTSDMAVAEEASITAEALGIKVDRLRDVGVAGLHRLLESRESLDRADVVIVVAGMDGALASIVGGLVRAPVVAVPTSVGYGAGAGDIAPLLTMLNACAPGVAVVNIDNGFGAAMFAATILNSR